MEKIMFLLILIHFSKLLIRQNKTEFYKNNLGLREITINPKLIMTFFTTNKKKSYENNYNYIYMLFKHYYYGAIEKY